MECELCGEECEHRSGCSRCGRFVCDGCLAAYPEDEDPGEPVCEECF